MTKALKVVSNFEPAGSQPDAIKSLVGGLNDGLLHQTLLGVTGSGKTEVYFKVLQNKFFLNSQILILFPEVSLSNEFVRRIEDRFGFSPEIWHSKISASQKKKIFLNLLLSS